MGNAAVRMELIIAAYAAVVSTVVAVLHWNKWRHERVGVQLTVRPRVHDLKPERFGHIEIDVQATSNPTSIGAIYFAAYKGKWSWMLGREPAEILGGPWSKVFPVKIEPGHGWEGLLGINDPERALAARYPHVRIMVRHTGYGRIASSEITKLLRREQTGPSRHR